MADHLILLHTLHNCREVWMEQKGFHYYKLSFMTHFIDIYLWLGCRRSLCL